MGLLRKNSKKKVEEIKTTGVDESVEQTAPSVEPAPIVENKKSKTIRKGVKVTVNGRLYGAPTKEAPMGYAMGEFKVIDVDKEHGTIKTEEGWLSISSVVE